MTAKHWHHIVPKHAGGDNSPENLIHLTVEEHAEAHKVLYETYGRWQDKIAWKTLSGQISIQEAKLIMLTEYNPMFNPETVEKVVSKRKANGSYYTNSKFVLDNPMFNPETIEKLSGENHWSNRPGKIHNSKVNHPRGASKKVSVDGIIYNSIRDAAKALNCDVRKIKKIGTLL